jgi:hypothetical protein
MNLSYKLRERLKLKASHSNLQLVKKYSFLLMLCTQSGMRERQIMSGITDTKVKISGKFLKKSV